MRSGGRRLASDDLISRDCTLRPIESRMSRLIRPSAVFTGPTPSPGSRCLTSLVIASCLSLCPCPQPSFAGDPVVSSAPSPACDDEATDPWVVDLRTRVLTFDGLAKLAIDRFGDPVACHGRVDGVFDGSKYGTLELGFPNDVALVVETMPLETSRVTLSAPHGFESPDEARRRFREYVDRIGVELDWSRPEMTTEGADRVLVFRSDEPGLDASAELRFAGSELRVLRFSIAL